LTVYLIEKSWFFPYLKQNKPYNQNAVYTGMQKIGYDMEEQINTRAKANL